MLNQLTFVLEMTKINNFYDLISSLDHFSRQKTAILIRAYLDINIFPQQGKLWGQYDLAEIIFVHNFYYYLIVIFC